MLSERRKNLQLPGLGRTDSNYLALTTDYLPHPRDLVGLATTWCLAVILMLAGAMFVGRRILPEVQIVSGWGVLCLVLTIWGVLVPVSLVFPAASFVATW